MSLDGIMEKEVLDEDEHTMARLPSQREESVRWGSRNENRQVLGNEVGDPAKAMTENTEKVMGRWQCNFGEVPFQARGHAVHEGSRQDTLNDETIFEGITRKASICGSPQINAVQRLSMEKKTRQQQL